MNNVLINKSNLDKGQVNSEGNISIAKRINESSQKVENQLGLPNSYGRAKLKPENIKIAHEEIVNDFGKYFGELGYFQEEEVGINSGIDNSVYFIGAPISVLKPYIIQQNIPEEGVFMSQSCIRTRNTQVLYDDDNIPKWGSCFTGMAVLVPISKGQDLLRNSISYLLDTLSIPLENIKIQINSQDKDLKKLLNDIDCPIEQIEDKKEDKYYQHKYGMGDIVGRNFNFVLREKGTDNFNDIGNFIIIENDDKGYGIELALGTSVIMKELYELDHIMDTSSISRICPDVHNLNTKFKDTLVSSVLLLRSGVIPNASNGKNRILRSYIRGILYFCNKFNIPEELLLNIINEYELEEFNENTGLGDLIIEYINKTKQDLTVKHKTLSKEEKFLV